MTHAENLAGPPLATLPESSSPGESLGVLTLPSSVEEMDTSAAGPVIWVVDADAAQRAEVVATLRPFYLLREFADAAVALASLPSAPPGVVVAAEQAGVQGGVDFVRALRRQPGQEHTPLVFVADAPENRARALLAGADDCLIKPYRRSTLVDAVSSQINAQVEDSWEALPAHARAALRETLSVFGRISERLLNGGPVAYDSVTTACEPLVEVVNRHEHRILLDAVRGHDNYTYAHSLRVATLLALFGGLAGLRDEEQLVLASGGLLHDVGKMSIPHAILNKPGRLTEEEFAVMKSHVPATLSFLERNPDLPASVLVIAGQHHEKLDGTGYPNGFKGSNLNELARMAAIVDVFSALTDYRAYKLAMPAEQALRIMTDDMQTHLDQQLLRVFKATLLDCAA